ncbi:hypothetical protein BDZ94DRAFT_1159222 [Collybia nuda]|uniref:GST N-terminal domain-containing protein n=1 Tax=Collybia nuda TaxID=64659 RepID=A0A9P5Y9M6_9AGAR|nr:hypothetical protein BDZ94DRAFT_1159222 [Collybia nuda]
MSASWKTKIIFFDIPTQVSLPTSPNTWKVRLVLNFKGLEYETRWVPTTDIQSVCKSLNIPPTGTKPTGDLHYTLPAIIDYTQSSSIPAIISDSTPIIQYLEHTYPSPSHKLFPDGTEAEYRAFETFLLQDIMKHAPSLWFVDNLNAKPPIDQADFRVRMEGRFGKKFEEIELRGEEREAAWQDVERAFKKLSGFFPKGKNGQYLTGDMVSFPDFALCGFLLFIKNISPNDAWEKIASWEDGKWCRYLEAFGRWMAVDRHPSRL